MNLNARRAARYFCSRILAICLVLSTFVACKPDGYINTVKHNGEKHVNTCETFTEAVNKLVQNNNEATRLRVSEYDNSDFSYFYLEPGQFEVKGDSLYFRLARDLEYPQYLAKGVAVHVNASYEAVENLKSLEGDDGGELGTLVVDPVYYSANRKPFFLYKFPLNGKNIEGKQIMLSFAIAKYDKKGNIKQFYCESDATPIGVARPACCTANPWQATQLQSVIEAPELEVNQSQFVWDGFSGTIDVQFQESSAKLTDDNDFSAEIIQTYVDKYRGAEYAIKDLDLEGYASPGGRETYNQKLSQRRADALKEGLTILNGNLEGLDIEAAGKGEDWERVKVLTGVSSLTREQKDEVLAICNDAELSNDAKEAKLRKVSYWETLVEEVLIKARHTFATMDFDYEGKEATLTRYDQSLPVASSRLEEVVTKPIVVSPYADGADVAKGLAHVDDILSKTATPELYAMRATYHIADEEYDKAIADLEKAGRFRDANANMYGQAIQSFKIKKVDSEGFDARKAMFDDFTKLTEQNPGDRALFFNRAVIMDKIGYISGAMAEYTNLLEGYDATAVNLNNRGVAKLKTNRVTEAKADFEAAVAADDKLAEAYFNLAAVSAYKGLTRQTIEMLDKAIELDNSFKGMIFNNPVFSVMSEDPRFEKYRN